MENLWSIDMKPYTPEQAREVLAEYKKDDVIRTHDVNKLQGCLSEYGEKLTQEEIEKTKTLLENYKAWEKWD